MFGLVSSSSASQPVKSEKRASAAKKRKGEAEAAMDEEESPQQQEMLLNIAKLTLRNSLAERTLKSACIDTLTVPSGHELIQTVSDATKNYTAVAKSITNEQDRLLHGCPHLHAWQALVTYMRKVMVEKQSSVEKIDALVAYIGTIEDKKIKNLHLQNQVRHVKIAKCWNSSIKKIEVSTKPGSSADQAWSEMKFFLAANGAMLRQGVAPRSGFERELQNQIDNLG
eukprot:TRINITY_DN51604_c0_g1_i1.p2 TRINITY_DN51604_c0_g1~~TRINITY_DN51604_c0_g1_i1.p2  ORF type:complete len:226 (+),score=58.36 TRINITY_DN51604_c0_g1_i1:71-748(+)